MSKQIGRIDDGEVETEDDDSVGESSTDTRNLVTDLLSYTVGCLFGRWDIRFAAGERVTPELPDPFAPLPVCSPGMLTNYDRLPLSETPLEYPLEINWEGILVDDHDHRDDIVRRALEVLRVIWQDRAEAIEQESVTLKRLRSYANISGDLAMAASGRIMSDVILKAAAKRLFTGCSSLPKRTMPSGFYYHRLDKDTLFKALTKYVEPKICLEDSRLEQWRVQLVAVWN